jgi:hypothetical protein
MEGMISYTQAAMEGFEHFRGTHQSEVPGEAIDNSADLGKRSLG